MLSFFIEFIFGAITLYMTSLVDDFVNVRSCFIYLFAHSILVIFIGIRVYQLKYPVDTVETASQVEMDQVKMGEVVEENV